MRIKWDNACKTLQKNLAYSKYPINISWNNYGKYNDDNATYPWTDNSYI